MPKRLLRLYMIGVLSVSFLQAQSSKGIVVGTVTDASGARVPGATVNLIHMATGVHRETLTLDAGTFRVDAVDPGFYRIEVSLTGFRTSALENVPVETSQTTDRSFVLETGSPADVVQVLGETGVNLQTQDTSLSRTVDRRQLVYLPLSNLNPGNLVFTLPGVVDPGALGGGFVQGTEFSVNGLRPRSNNQLLDGTDNNDNSITGQAYQPYFREAFDEATFLKGINPAEYGWGGGGVTNVTTSRGSNDFHGGVYDLIDTSYLYSLSPGEKINEGLKGVPVSIENTFGFHLGGPIRQNQLFFFVSMQPDLFRSVAVNASAQVPTQSGFDQLRTLFPPGRSDNLDRYLGVIGDLRGTVNPFLVPLGGGRPAIQFGTVTRSFPQPVNDLQWLGRIDWTPTLKDSYAFRYLYDHQTFDNQFPAVFSGYEVDVDGRSQNVLLSHTHTFSPKLINEARFSYQRHNVFFGPRGSEALLLPRVGFAGTQISSIGLVADFPQGRTFNNYQVQETVTRVATDHSFRMGVDLIRQLARQLIPFEGRGILAFSAGGGFNAFANFVDRFSGTQGVFGSKSFGDPVVYPNVFRQAYFIQDTWRVRDNLTFNLGLRYENAGTPENVLRFPAFAGMTVPLETRVEQKNDRNNFAPRIGMAYRPRASNRLFGGDRTVFRLGWGMSYDVFFNNILINSAAGSPNVFGVTTLGSTMGGRGFPNAGITTLPATGAPNPLTGVTTIDPGLVNPLIHTWDVGIQREVPGNALVEVAYVGTRALRLFINEQANWGVSGRRTVPTRGPVTIRTNGGDSVYHSLQLSVERRLRQGISFRYAYTFSKAIDNVSEVFLTTGGSSFQSDPGNRGVDRSVSVFDVPHRTVATFVWDLPGPRQGLWGQLAGFWTLSGNYRLQSGTVETAFIGGVDMNGDLSAFNDRPSIGNPNAPPNSVAIRGSIFGFPGFIDAEGNDVDPSSARYVVDPVRRTNIVGRNTLRGERTNRLDLSMNKGFPLPFEGHRLELRFEVFNAFNHPNFTWFGDSSDQSDGDVLNPFFNNVRLNFGSRRTARFEFKYVF